MQHYKMAEIVLTDNHSVETFSSLTAELINFGTFSVDLKRTPYQCDKVHH
jgi:hypothetical protein